MVRSIFRYIRYYFLGALMWCGWLIYPAYKVGFFKYFVTYTEAYGGIIKSFSLALRASRDFITENYKSLILPFVLNIVIYLIVYMIIKKYREIVFFDLIADEDLGDKELNAAIKEQKKEEKKLVRSLFDKNCLPE